MQSSLINPTLHPLIQRFPVEMLSEIFQRCVQEDYLPAIVRAAGVCHWWREVALSNPKLWTLVKVTNTSIRDHSTLLQVLGRSNDHPLSLHLVFEPSNLDDDFYVDMAILLTTIVTDELKRCASLTFVGGQIASGVVARAFKGESFPHLRRLTLHNLDASMHWQAPPADGKEPPLAPEDFVFRMDPGHCLTECSLRGFGLPEDDPLPHIEKTRIINHTPDMVVNDMLNPHIFSSPRTLSLNGVCVPVMSYPGATHKAQPQSTNLEILHLIKLRASPDYDLHPDGYYDHDSAPFFCALDTSRLTHFTMEEWDFGGNILDDFLRVLMTESAKFPHVVSLTMRRMDFWLGLSDPETFWQIVAFLEVFPALEHLCLQSILEWRGILEVLSQFPDVCPRLREVEIDEEVFQRGDPLHN